jgi:hypothetical protein
MGDDKSLYEHYIDLLITDCSINVYNSTDFASYGAFATYIHNLVSGKKIDGILKYLVPIIDDIEYVYGLDRDDCTLYVLTYFLNKKWEKYYKPVNMIRDVFGKFLLP